MSDIHTKATLPQRAMHELKELVLISLYLYVVLGAVILIKTAVLRDQASNSPLGASPSSRRWCWRNSC